MKYHEILLKGNQVLKANKIKNSNLDCELMLSKVLNKTREEILINLNNKINKKQKNEFIFYLNKRKKKTPISYILGFKHFWRFKFYLNKSTLIPRPESEHLVEQTLKLIPIRKSINILDIGTGSGCLIISLLNERQNCIATAIDLSKEALKVAKINAKLHHLENKIKFFNIDIDKFNSNKYDLIISNPPYINKVDLNRLDDDVRLYEPKLALYGGTTGFEEIKKIIKKSYKILKYNGKLIIEIGDKQKNYTIEILLKNGFYINNICKDFSGKDRCLVSTKVN
ncbi:MAG: peptide chain release factor N(5)-glutamine methyltransferase [Candidatus Pelagibacter sp.]